MANVPVDLRNDGKKPPGLVLKNSLFGFEFFTVYGEKEDFAAKLGRIR